MSLGWVCNSGEKLRCRLSEVGNEAQCLEIWLRLVDGTEVNFISGIQQDDFVKVPVDILAGLVECCEGRLLREIGQCAEGLDEVQCCGGIKASSAVVEALDG